MTDRDAELSNAEWSLGVSVETEEGDEMSWKTFPRLPDSTSFAQRNCNVALFVIEGASEGGLM